MTIKRYHPRMGGDQITESPFGDYVRYEDHQAIIQRQAAAALAGMDAAKRVSSADLQAAARMRAESSPDALESERAANAILTTENERLKTLLKEILEELQESDTRHDLQARILLWTQVPQRGEHEGP